MRSVFGLALAVAVHALVLGLLRGRDRHPLAVEFQVRPARGAMRGPLAPRPEARAGREAAAPKASPRRVAPAWGPRQAPIAALDPGPAQDPVAPAQAPALTRGPPGPLAGAAAIGPTPGGLRCPAWAPCQGSLPAPASAGGERAAERDLQAVLLARIAAHRRYPELARRRGIEGTVELRFAVRPDGQIAYVEISSSAEPSLDEAARQALLLAAPLPAVAGPRTVLVHFRLHDGHDEDGKDRER